MIEEVPSYTGKKSSLRRSVPPRTPKIARSAPMKRKVGKVSAKKKKKRTKAKTWTLKKCDTIFSVFIRQRDGMCLFPGCGSTRNLTCSHYFGRAVKSTRFDPDNCITLCGVHHFWDKMIGYEFQKQREEEHGWDGRYTLFMKQWLGEERWQALLSRAKEGISQKKAIEAYMATQLPGDNEQKKEIPVVE